MAFAAAHPDASDAACHLGAAPGRACRLQLPSPPGDYKLGKPYQIQGRWYYPAYDPNYDRVGVASWYGEPFHGRRTANGEVFDRDMVTAAHPTLPLPSLVRVVNLQNRRELVVRVNDRGPFVDDRLIDLSQEAARQLGFEGQGLAPVRVQFVSLADAQGAPPQPTIRHVQAHRARARRRACAAAGRDGGCPVPRALHSGGRVRRAGARAARHGGAARPATGAGDRWHRSPRISWRGSGSARSPMRRQRMPTLDRLKRSGFSEAFIMAREEELAPSC